MKIENLLRSLCLSTPIQSFLSRLFPFKEPLRSPLGLTNSCLGFDPDSRCYIQETWLQRQLHPLYAQDILWIGKGGMPRGAHGEAKTVAIHRSPKSTTSEGLHF